jgi:Domain of unknown function (DUF4168)
MFKPVRSHFSLLLLPRLLLAAMIILLGNGESFSFRSFSAVVLAQTSNQPLITPQQVSDYAAAVLEIEPIRLKYYDQARKQTNGKIPPNLCLENEKTNVVNELASICSSYMEESQAVIIKHDLTQDQFNAITTQAQTDRALSDRIQQQLRQHQKLNSKAEPADQNYP